MRRQELTGILLAAAGMLALAGCYEETGVTVYEAGEYKGSQDPLLEKQRAEAQQERLNERFQLVQTDR